MQPTQKTLMRDALDEDALDLVPVVPDLWPRIARMAAAERQRTHRRRRVMLSLAVVVLVLGALSSVIWRPQDPVERALAATAPEGLPPGSVEYLRSVDQSPTPALNGVLEAWHQIGTSRSHRRFSSPAGPLPQVPTTGQIVVDGTLTSYTQWASGVVETQTRALEPQDSRRFSADSIIQGIRDELSTAAWSRRGAALVNGHLVERVEKPITYRKSDPQNPGQGVERRALSVLYIDRVTGLPVQQELYDVEGAQSVLVSRYQLEFQVIPPDRVPPDLFQPPASRR